MKDDYGAKDYFYQEFIDKEKDYITVEDNKISFVEQLKPSKQQLKVLEFLNEQGFYHIRINKKVLLKTLKAPELAREKKIDRFNKKIKFASAFIKSGLPKITKFGIFINFKDDDISFYLPRFLLKKENLVRNINKFFELITPKKIDPMQKMFVDLGKKTLTKLFIRINRDEKGAHIFANLVDSVAKLGLMFLIQKLLMEELDVKPENMVFYIEYFVNFIIENIVTLVSPNCRIDKLSKELLENGEGCEPGKFVASCPSKKIYQELKCPKPSCPQKKCKKCPQKNCPTCPKPKCKPCEKCPDKKCDKCPDTKCPKIKMDKYYGAIAFLVGLIILLLFLKKK